MNPEFQAVWMGLQMIGGLWIAFWVLSWLLPPVFREYREMYNDWIQKRMFKAKEERQKEMER